LHRRRRITDFEKFIRDERACYKKCKDGFKCEKITLFFELLDRLKKCIQPSLLDDYQEKRKTILLLLIEMELLSRKIKDCYYIRIQLQGKGYNFFYTKRH